MLPDALPQLPTPRETKLFGFGDDETLPGADCEDFSLIVSDEEDKADVPPVVEWARPDRTDKVMLPEPEKGTVKLPRQRMGWARQGVLMSTLFLGSLFAGLQLFGASSTVLARQESTEANAGDPARAVDLPPVPQIVPVNSAKERDNVLNSTGQNAQPAAPVAVPPAAPVAAKAPVTANAPARAIDARPKAAVSLYARVRQAVLENKTEETDRLGLGDIAYEDVPDDGSIMVGMAVTYAPFFNHQIIKSVQAVYQAPNGRRYDGPVCGTPTGVGERVVAKEGYAIGGATIRSGMGIDAMQLTFMEIGAEALNPNKTYLSKWLGMNGGSYAKTFVNDGRPIIGIAGMRSSGNPNGPAFCMCLITTKAGALPTPAARATTRPQQ
jgi:hypothetical protein